MTPHTPNQRHRNHPTHWFPEWFPTGSQHPPGGPHLSGSPGSPSP